jgi:hypothetical protein
VSARVICLETEKARRMGAGPRFSTIALEGRAVHVDITGSFSPAAVRVLANALLAQADNAELDGKGS